MTTRSISAVLLLLVGLAQSNAQGTKRRAPASRPSEPITTQTAKTEDGRTVVLKSDGTWEYVKGNEGSAITKVATGGRKDSTLSFEVGLVYQSGDVKPVARTTFYLLNDNLGTLLKEAGLQPLRGLTSNRPPEEELIYSFGSSLAFTMFDDFKTTAMAVIKPHFVQVITTDFGGKASFEPIAAGTYYLMGVTKTPRGYAFWNLKVNLKSGNNSVTLDQNNAVTAV